MAQLPNELHEMSNDPGDTPDACIHEGDIQHSHGRRCHRCMHKRMK